jgi:beta-glucosidase
MSLDEKIAMLHGAPGSPFEGYVPANKRLGIPALKMLAGPAGVNQGDVTGGVTQLPAPVAGAASWNLKIMRHYGTLIGAETLGKGANLNLGTAINIVRDPRWGRAFEMLGEDPYLTSKLVVAEINGIQHRGVLAQAKHWDAYNQETHRNTEQDDVLVSRRVLHEIYMPAFKAAIKQGHVSSLMCSYSVVNGKFACENPYLLTGVLRNQWAFKGFVVSDWWATHSTVAAAKAGLDVEMPNSTYFSTRLKAAIQSGKVGKSLINAKVRRILFEMFRFGLFDRPNRGGIEAVVTNPAHARFARRAAEQGTVLLKNKDRVLPLGKATQSIAVIGADAGPDVMTAGGGSAYVIAPYVVTPLQGIKKRAGGRVSVQYVQGDAPYGSLPIIRSKYLTSPSTKGHGLRGEYYTNADFSGSPAFIRVDSTIDFSKRHEPRGKGLSGKWSARWSGMLTPAKSGTYRFSLLADGISKLYVGGKPVIIDRVEGYEGLRVRSAKVKLTARHPVKIRVEYAHKKVGALNRSKGLIKLGWLPPGTTPPSIEKAAQAARQASIAVVFAGHFESEGYDLDSLALPGIQNRLIDAVAKANPNTVVVLNTGMPVAMPWLKQVAGVIEAWYPGQEDGNAIAAVLFGDVNPSGHLPVTFPRNLEQVPAHTQARWPGVDGKVHYSEGLLVGYRWYDRKHIKPLYPFGYGLSYTHFQMKHLKIAPSQMKSAGRVRVSFDIANTGKRAGADVVQLYIGDPASVSEPPKQLKAFKKVYLKAHEHKKVMFKLDPSAFSYWTGDAKGWAVKDGKYRIDVGDSSRHLPLTGQVRIARAGR